MQNRLQKMAIKEAQELVNQAESELRRILVGQEPKEVFELAKQSSLRDTPIYSVFSKLQKAQNWLSNTLNEKE